MHQPDRHGIQEVELLAPRSPGHDETRILEHPQMLHDAEARHLDLRLELRERAAVTFVEPVEQEPPRRIGERLEDVVVVGQRWKNM